jgi:hypothetical protein
MTVRMELSNKLPSNSGAKVSGTGWMLAEGWKLLDRRLQDTY